MPTQTDIGDHLDLSQAEVSKLMAELEIDWRVVGMDDIRVAYIRKLRAVAAGHKSSDGMDLTRERVLTEQIDREMKQLALAEKRGQLVNVAQLEPELRQMFGAFKAELLTRDDKLRSEIEAMYGIDLDPQLLEDHTRAALRQLARYDPEHQGTVAPAGDGAGAGGEDEHDGLGDRASSDVGQEHVQAG
nr:MarR family transcriptional regulator [uncultured Roseateles sp.]